MGFRFDLIIIFLLIQFQLAGQTTLHQELFEYHETCKETVIKDRRFKQIDILPLIRDLPDHLFSKEVLGKSLEGRDIFLIRMGRGPENVLVWSQMHGNEPTATMAIFDIFNFFKDETHFTTLKSLLLNELSLYFIPMLNPDGADRFQRRTALDIDLNRDALRLQNPESIILKKIRDRLEPQWGFNLHDQNRYTSAGWNPHIASISFLAPAYNYKKEWGKKRNKAMQLIVSMNQVLQTYIPDNVGRYNDEFEPRAFGDNIQKWGTGTILIETGGRKGDREKQFLRKMNFLCLLTGFEAIATQSYQKQRLKDYEAIPLNKGAFHDLLIRNATLIKGGKRYTMDIGFRNSEIQYPPFRDYYLRGSISDIGDLHNYYGYQELDATGMNIVPGKTYPKRINSMKKIQKIGILKLLKNGFTHIKMKKLPPSHIANDIPFYLDSDFRKEPNIIRLGNNPSFFLQKEKQLVYLISNGQIYHLHDDQEKLTAWFKK